jgi:hypothetical protein
MNYHNYFNKSPIPPGLLQLLQGQQQRPAFAMGGTAFGPIVEPRFAQGGIPQYVDGGTGAGGREDNIDAKLSENEYVFDAETVALLGDGNPDAGAKKLDEMRQSIRQHKGQYLTHGKISPDAKHPMQYLDYGSGK